MRKTSLKLMFAGLLLTSCFGATPVLAISPTEQVQEAVQQVLTVVASSPGNEQRRREILWETLTPRFDWLEMAKQSLGKHWSSATGRENEFVSAFAEFLGNAYIGQISSYRDEKIFFLQESIDNDRAQVNTKIISDKGETASVNYRLHRVGGDWKIYDVVVEDVSLVVNYRSQFNRILAKRSFDDLLKQLREKQ